MLLMRHIVLVSSIFAGLWLPSSVCEAKPPIKTDGLDPKQTLAAFQEAVKRRDALALYQLLPATYQKKLQAGTREVIGKINEPTWKSMIASWKKGNKILQAKEKVILAQLDIPRKNMPVDKKRAQAVQKNFEKWLALSDKIFSDPQLSDYNKAKEVDIKKCLANIGPALLDYTHQCHLIENWSDKLPSAPEDFYKNIKIVHQTKDLATVHFHDPELEFGRPLTSCPYFGARIRWEFFPSKQLDDLPQRKDQFKEPLQGALAPRNTFNCINPLAKMTGLYDSAGHLFLNDYLGAEHGQPPGPKPGISVRAFVLVNVEGKWIPKHLQHFFEKEYPAAIAEVSKEEFQKDKVEKSLAKLDQFWDTLAKTDDPTKLTFLLHGSVVDGQLKIYYSDIWEQVGKELPK